MRAIALLAAGLASAAAAQPDRSRWPRAIEVEQGTLTVYQPQLEKLEGVTLSGRSAVSWQARRAPAPAPVFGVFWFEARVLVDKDLRRMDVEEVTVTKVRFPNVTPDQEKAVARLVETEVPRWDVHGSLDEVQAALEVTQKERASEKGLSVAPPKLVFSNDPAVLLLYDGKPALRPLPGTKVERVVNTALFVVRDPTQGKLFLAGGKLWYSATDPRGPWSPGATPSPAVKSAYDANPPPPLPGPDPALAASVATPREQPPPPEPSTPPRIVVATEPTELIVFDGKPSWAPVGKDGKLLYADNTDGRVLVHVPTSETFVLVSGRWYKSASLAGPWTPVRPDRLPAAFRAIPPESPVVDVRAFVTGTPEAEDALADAHIPQTTAVKRGQTLEVTYDGEPRFKRIEGTALAYAVNTPFSVIQDSGKYWCCHQGVWYVAPSPKGPWTVSDRRPPSIDQLPPSSPVYDTKYVYVYQSTPEVVYVGYLPGYVGAYPYYGTVVYGTGYWYPPYIGSVYCYPYPATFGLGVSFTPWAGWGVGVSWGTPFFSVGVHFGGYGRAYGPVGYRAPYRPAYGYRSPPPGYRASGVRPPPAGFTPAAAARPPQQPSSNIYGRPENASRNAQMTAASRQQPAVSSQPNDLYGDRNGNVYRQNPSGSWDKNTAAGWQQAASQPRQPAGGGAPAGMTAPAPSPTTAPAGGGAPAGLSSDAAARSLGSGSGGGRGAGFGGGRGGGGGRR